MVTTTVGCDMRPDVMQAILAVGAGSMAVNAVKGVLGGGGKGEEEVNKAAKKVGSDSADDGISKALDSLRKSGKALPVRPSDLSSVLLIVTPLHGRKVCMYKTWDRCDCVACMLWEHGKSCVQ